MLPAPFRLNSAKAFAHVFRDGHYASFQALALKWRPTHLPSTQVGFIASKKIFAKAHDRNKAKRLIREALHAKLFQLQPGFDIIVLYRYKPAVVNFETLSTTLYALLEKNNLLQKKS